MTKRIETRFNLEAEMYLLGTLLFDRTIALVSDKVSPQDFYRDIHQTIFEAMLVLYRRNETIDFISVSEVLTQQNISIQDEIGGGLYLMDLVHNVNTDFLRPSEHVEKWADIVADCALARQGLSTCQQVAQSFYSEPARVAQAKAEAAFAQLGQNKSTADFTPIQKVIDETVERVSAMQSQGGVIVGIPTGFRDLDKLLSGFRNEKLILLAGRPGSGKTSFALTVAHFMAKKAGRSVGILSLEMSKEELSERLIALDASIDARRISTGMIYDDEWDRFVASSEKLAELPIHIDDSFGSTLMDLRSRAKRLQAKHGLDILFIDYLQLMESEEENLKENEARQLAIISRGLKGFAREMNIPVVALAQLNRETEKRHIKVPQISDLRGSGNLEQDADIIIFLYREEEYDENTTRKGLADVIVAKHRGGPKGTEVLRFNATLTKFDNYISEEEASQYA